MAVKEVASKAYKVFEKLLIAAVMALAAHMFVTLDALKAEVHAIKANKEENSAQWKVLTRQDEQQKDLEIEVKVYQRLFELLCDQNKLKVDRINFPKLPVLKKRSYEDFREEQMIQQAAPPNLMDPRKRTKR